MRLIVKSTIIMATLCSIAAVTHAVEHDTDAGYTNIGESRNCIDRRQMKRADAVDNENVNFIMSDGTIYRNILLNSCSILRDADRFSYNAASRSQLCRGDRISSLEIIGNIPRTFGSCSLGSFQEIKMIEKSDDI